MQHFNHTLVLPNAAPRLKQNYECNNDKRKANANGVYRAKRLRLRGRCLHRR